MIWRSWFNRRRWEKQMDAEFHFHLESQIDDYVRQGLGRKEAESRARREFGGLDLAKEECRDQRAFEPLDHLWRDLRYASRSLKKSPGFTAAAILILAIAIGANTATFSALQGAVLQPLPYRQPDRLVLVALYNATLKSPTYASYPDYLDWQQSSRSFDRIAAYKDHGFDLSNPGPPEHLEGTEVSANFFQTLGINLALGRELLPDEDRIGGPPAVVISDRLWRDRFAASPAALDRTVTLGGVDYLIVGVLQPGFQLDRPKDVYTSIGRDNALDLTDRTVHDIACVARLKPDVGIEQARAEMNTVQEHIGELHPDTERGQGAWIEPLKQFLIGDIGGTLWLLLGAVGLLLLIACANIGNLLLARSASRTREFAVRLALGASRSQIVRQLVVETVLLCLAGGIAGLVLASWGLRGILTMVPGAVPRVENIGVNATVLWFAFAVSMTVGVGFGLLPALQSSKTDVQTGLRDGGRNSTSGPHVMQRILVVGQISLTLVLLTGGSLLFRTIHNLWAVNPGFDPEHVITFQVGLSPSVITTAARTRQAYRQLVERLHEIPGVEAADITGLVPLSQGRNEGPFWIGSRPPVSMAEIPRAIYYPIGPDYFNTMKIPLVRGRSFTSTDNADTELVVVVDSLLARSYFHDGNPIDQSITIPHWGARRDVAARIVGVVGHVEQYGLSGASGQKPQIYYPFYQLPDDAVPVFRSVLRMAVRTPLDVATTLPAIRGAVHAAGADQPVYNVQTMQEFLSGSMGRQRFSTLLLLAFAGIALALATVGTYAVISYSTTQRVHEIGIRIALGANAQDVLRLVIRQGVWLALIGVAIGTCAAWILAHLLTGFSHLLYGVQASDPLTIGAAALVLTITASLACYVPARRAARLDPTIALRGE